MSAQTVSELERFAEFVGETLKNGGASLSPEEVLEDWRAQNPTDAERAETLQAVREALDDIQAGRTRSLEEFDQAFRRRRRIDRHI